DRLAGGADLRVLRLAHHQPDRDRLGGLAGPGPDRAGCQPRRPGPGPAAAQITGAEPMSPAFHDNGGAANGDGSVVDLDLKALYYGDFKAVRDTKLVLKKNVITAFIGPSGCGKSTVLRCINRMNDLIRGFRLNGRVHYRGKDI